MESTVIEHFRGELMVNLALGHHLVEIHSLHSNLTLPISLIYRIEVIVVDTDLVHVVGGDIDTHRIKTLSVVKYSKVHSLGLGVEGVPDDPVDDLAMIADILPLPSPVIGVTEVTVYCIVVVHPPAPPPYTRCY